MVDSSTMLAAPGPRSHRKRTTAIIAGAVVVALIGIGVVASAARSSTDKAKKERDDARAELASTKSSLAALQVDLDTAGSELETAKAARTDAEVAQRTAEEEARAASAKALKDAKAKVAADRAKLRATEARVVAHEAQVAARERAVALVEGRIQANTISGDGIYAVGSDMQPGTYRSAGSADCYYAVLNSPDTSDIATNNITDGPAIASVAPGQYFETTRCADWVKSG